jgi:hypothetical protein
MHAVLRCPECGRPLKVPTEAFGKPVKGPCGHAFIAREELAAEAAPPPAVTAAPPKLQPAPRAEVPDEEVEERPAPRRRREREEEEEEYDDEPRRSRRRPARGSGGRTALIVVGAVVGAVLLICGGIAYIGYQFIKGVERAAKEIAKDFKNEFDKHPFGQGPGFGGDGIEGDAVGFATPDAAMDAYVKAVTEMDVGTYRKLIGKSPEGSQRFNDKLRFDKQEQPEYSEEFLGKALLNDQRMRWLYDNYVRLPLRAADGDRARIFLVWRAPSSYAERRQAEIFEFRREGDLWYLDNDHFVTPDQSHTVPAVPFSEGKPLVAAGPRLSPLEFNLLADDKLYSAVEAKALLPKLQVGVEFDGAGRIKQIKNEFILSDKELRCVYSLASPQLHSLRSSTKRLSDGDLEKLARLTGLEELMLYGDLTSGTQFSDRGLAHLSRLNKLKRLELNIPLATGTGLASLRDMQGLTILTLHGTFGDNALEHLREEDQLSTLYLRKSRIQGPGLANLKGLKKLSWLEIQHSLVRGPGLEHLAALPNLWELVLPENEIDGPGLKHLSGVTQVSGLILRGNLIDDDGLAHLATLQKLTSLDLSRNPIRGPGLAHLKGLPKLGSLMLFDTPLTNEALDQLSQLPALRNLCLTESPTFSPQALAKLRRAVPQVTLQKRLGR